MNATMTYPAAPGWKAQDTETSREAALAIKARAEAIRKSALKLLKEQPRTSDEVAVALRAPGMEEAVFAEFKRSVRPRISELKAEGLVEKTPERRPNSSGKSATVWRAVRVLKQEELL